MVEDDRLWRNWLNGTQIPSSAFVGCQKLGPKGPVERYQNWIDCQQREFKMNLDPRAQGHVEKR